jgi:hypothetical protein
VLDCVSGGTESSRGYDSSFSHSTMRACRPDTNAHSTHTSRTPCKNLRHALGDRLKVSVAPAPCLWCARLTPWLHPAPPPPCFLLPLTFGLFALFFSCVRGCASVCLVVECVCPSSACHFHAGLLGGKIVLVVLDSDYFRFFFVLCVK